LPKRSSQVSTAEAVPVEEELTLLRGFRDLVAERTGYFFGAKMLTKTMNDETAEERKAVRELSKTVSKNIEDYIENPTEELKRQILENRKKLKEAREKAKEARKPHLKKINPLRKAVKYIDMVAIPDSLKEMGQPVQPRFSLSEWIKKAIETKK